MAETTENNKSTGRLLEELMEAQSFSEFEAENTENMTGKQFTEYLGELCEKKGVSRSELVRRSCIERTYAYQIIRGIRQPARDKVLQFAVALALDLDDTQRLLKTANKGELYPRIRRDAALIFCITHGMELPAVQQFLFDLGEEPLSSETKGADQA